MTNAKMQVAFISTQLLNKLSYSTLGGKTDKLDEAVNRELNITRS